MYETNRLVVLDLVRGLSALLVCASHLRAAFLVDYSELISPDIFTKAFYFATGLGHQAVMVFFVLSGFFVGGSILKAGKSFSLKQYWIARLTRLWTVLIPILLLTLCVDVVLQAIYPGILRGELDSILISWPSPQYSISLSTFLGNLFFVQTVLTPVFGSNGPLWSLANEFWYYAIFPLLVIATQSSMGPLSIRIVYGALAFLLLYALPSGIVFLFIVWLMGVIVYVVNKKLSVKKRPLVLVSLLGLFVASLGYSKVTSLQEALMIPADLLIGLCFSLLCIVLIAWPFTYKSKVGVVIRQCSLWLSEISYSLYLMSS